MGIFVYNRTKETHTGPNNYPIFRGKSVLGNPYTDKKEGTLALYRVKTREEAIAKYALYFDTMYSGNKEFQEIIDEIYEKYKSGEDVYLECYCAPLPCHGDVIKEKLQKRLMKEKIKQFKNKQ